MLRTNLLVILVGVSACAARSQVPTIPLVSHYNCGDSTFDRGTSKLAWTDHDGDHYVNWPVSPADVETVEYTVPRNDRGDAIQHVWDTSRGTSRTEWRLLASEVCQSKGSDSYVLAKFMNGATIDDISRDLAVDHDQARELVHSAMLTMQKRWFRNH